jgi:hypothetical protein
METNKLSTGGSWRHGVLASSDGDPDPVAAGQLDSALLTLQFGWY